MIYRFKHALHRRPLRFLHVHRSLALFPSESFPAEITTSVLACGGGGGRGVVVGGVGRLGLSTLMPSTGGRPPAVQVPDGLLAFFEKRQTGKQRVRDGEGVGGVVLHV